MSATIARFRQELLATRPGVPVPTGAANTSALWTRLAEPESAFDVVRDRLQSGGLRRCRLVCAGPADSAVITETDERRRTRTASSASLSTPLGFVP